MERNAESKLLSNVIAITTLLTSLIVTPNLMLDPINLPKMAVLIIGSAIALGLVASSFSNIFRRDFGQVGIIFIAYIAILLISLAFSDEAFTQGFYGVYGRNTGFLTYASFITIFYSAALISNSQEIIKIHKYFYCAGGLATIYGLLQFLGFDPAGWDIYASPVVVFLGNADFASAFLAMFATSAFTLGVLYPKNKKLNFTVSFSAMFVTFLTQAKQGLIAFILGASVVVLVIAIKANNRKLISSYVIAAIFGISGLALGILNLGPIGHLVYKSSLEARFYYWQAALRMFKDNFISGVGLDAFGDYYARYRTLDAVNWNTQPTNVAHNVFLDYAANGGVFFLIINLLVILLVLKSFTKVVIRDRNFNAYYIAIFSSWVAFQAQSLISINQIGLAVWNWVFAGLLIGYEINARITLQKDSRLILKNNRLKEKEFPINSKSIISGSVAALISIFAILPVLIGSANYWKLLNSGDLSKIRAAANIYPKDEYKYWVVILTLNNNATAIDDKYSNPNSVEVQSEIDKLRLEALQVTKRAVEDFPNSVHLWRLYAKNPMASEREVQTCEKRIKYLDPFNPEV